MFRPPYESAQGLLGKLCDTNLYVDVAKLETS